MTQGHRAPVSKSGQGSICRCAASGSRECFPCEGERQVCAGGRAWGSPQLAALRGTQEAVTDGGVETRLSPCSVIQS